MQSTKGTAQKTSVDSSHAAAFDGLFIVDLRKLELEPEKSVLIEKAIQAAVLAALGALDIAPTSRGGEGRIGGGETMGFRGDDFRDIRF